MRNFIIVSVIVGLIVYISMPSEVAREKVGEAFELVRKDDCIAGSFITLVPFTSGTTTSVIAVTNYIYGEETAMYSSQKYKITYDNGEVKLKTIDTKLKTLTGCS